MLQVLDQQLTPSLCFPYLKTQKRCGFEIVSPLLGSLGFYSQWLYLHQEFNLMVKKGAVDTARIKEYIKRNESLLPPPGHAMGTASRVIGWSDRNVAVENKANCQQVYEKLKALGDKPETFLFNECSAPLQELETHPDSLLNRIEQTIPQDLLTLVDFKRSLTVNPGVGFFLYSGARDAYVPEDDFQEELQTVGSPVHYTHFLDTGHDGFYTEPQVWDDLIGN